MLFGFRNLAPLNTPVVRIFKQIASPLLLLNSCVFAMSSSLLKGKNHPLALPSELPAEGQAGSGGARTTFITIRQHRQEDKGLWGGNREYRVEQNCFAHVTAAKSLWCNIKSLPECFNQDRAAQGQLQELPLGLCWPLSRICSSLLLWPWQGKELALISSKPGIKTLQDLGQILAPRLCHPNLSLV